MIKWVVRLALITSLLGIAGAAIIFIRALGGSTNEKISSLVKQETPSTSAKENNPLTFTHKPSDVKKADSKPLIVFKKPDNLKTGEEISKAVGEKENKTLQPKTVEDSRTRKERVLEEKNELILQKEKLLSDVELDQLVTRINAAKEENGIYLNCVQLRVSRYANNNRIPSQIEAFLRSRSFAIAGRELISKKVKGIQISATNECIRIIVGIL